MKEWIKTFLETLFIGFMICAIVFPNKMLGIFM